MERKQLLNKESMKSIFRVFALLLISQMSSAQYLENSNFISWKAEGETGSSWASAENTYEQRPGTEPLNWAGSNVVQSGYTADELCTKGEENGSPYVILKNGGILGNVIPAYLTIGTPWVFASLTGTNVTFMDTEGASKMGDGGSFGGISFTNKPDALRVKYKKSGTTETAHIIAYLWNGTFTSKVPNHWKRTNTGSFFNPVYSYEYDGWTSQDNIDRAVLSNVLGVEADANITQKGNLVAWCDKEISVISENNEWETIEIPLTYIKENKGETPTMANVIISAGDYWTRSNLQENSQLDIAEVQFVYSSELSSLEVSGENILLQEGVTEYEVKGSPIYGCVSAIPESEWASVRYEYFSDKVKITVTANDNTTQEYRVVFKNAEAAPNAQEIADTYTNDISVVFQGSTSSSINDIIIGSGDNNTATFTLNNFTFAGMNVGNIIVKDVNLLWGEDESIVLNSYQNISITGGDESAAALGLENLPMEMIATVDKDGNLTATLSIIWNKQEIIVYVSEAPFKLTNGVLTASATVTDDLLLRMYNELPTNEIKTLDFRNVSIETVEIGISDFLTVLPNSPHNILAYITSAGIEGTNIINNNVCSSLVISDGAEFNAPYDFTATTASYDRTNLTTGWVYSFVLPVAVPAANINGTVYELVGYEDGVLNFAEVTTTLEANKPYIVKATSANLFNSASNVSVAATTEATLENTVSDGAVHVGTYTSQSVTSDASTSYYGYKGGVFVKANTGTLNPFRTMIKVSGQQTLSTLALSFDGEVTGIGSIVDGELQLNGTVDVYDLNGRLVRQGAKAANSLQGLPTGVYVVNGQKVMVK